MTQGPAAHVDISATGVVKASGGQLVAVVLTPAAATATLILQDDPDSADGTVLVKLQAAADGNSTQFSPAIPYVFATGCYATISGTGANATVVIL